jgi:carboxyl-terminal processing protease
MLPPSAEELHMKVISIFLFIFSFTAFSQSLDRSTWTVKDYWLETNLSFEKVIYGEINDVTCYRTEVLFVACINAINTALGVTEPHKKYYVNLDEKIKSPISGFSILEKAKNDPEIESFEKTYFAQLRANYKNHQSVFVFRRGTFSMANSYIAQNVFVDEEAKSYHTAIMYNAFLAYAYDPHTYITPTNYQKQRQQSATVVKIFGLTYAPIKYNNNDHYLIRNVVKNSPIEKAGIEAGDIILSLNDNRDFKTLANEMQNSTVVFNVIGSKGIRNLKVTKAEVSVPQVEAKLLTSSARKTGYIKLKSFQDKNACTSIAEYGSELLNKGAEGVILDLRDNGGGLVSIATCLMSLYLEKDATTWVVKYQSGNKANQVVREQVKNPKYLFSDIHTITLINGYSASASEALAMYLQAYRKSFIVGERSYGKGTMQSLSATKENTLVTKGETVAKYYGPQNISPQLQGVVPDFVVYPDFEQVDPTPYMREADRYSNAIVNESKAPPIMTERKEQLAEISKCLKINKSVVKAYHHQDSFKKRVFDNQLASAKAVLACANDLAVPVF